MGTHSIRDRGSKTPNRNTMTPLSMFSKKLSHIDNNKNWDKIQSGSISRKNSTIIDII
jgi:hypothetical protein